MERFAFAVLALTIGAIGAIGDGGVISTARAAEPRVAAVSAVAYQGTPNYHAGVIAEGVPCAPMMDGRTPHYTWKPGYTQKGRWEYHWACEL